ncbi:helix-turn-helix transcriptional regulator [Pseudofrankia sp. BMG5.37]|uniref:helix-turn-helix domain-containing protein n=1 Tax=Pseudofrankia sp. BMG5.37 TaxID=3050035 RepID=UPI00289DC16C|nr:helix-turn-helix transcriptional regulator [Pseudofrankia sp. BMG5.37]
MRKYRRQQGLSQAALADCLGVSRTTITNIEHCTQGVTLLTFVQLAEQLDVDAAELLREVLSGQEESGGELGKYQQWVDSLAITSDTDANAPSSSATGVST